MAEETINQQTEDSTPTTDDFIPTWDVTGGIAKKASIANIRTTMETTRWTPLLLGRTTLGGSADTISVTGLTAKTYLTVYVALRATGGTITCAMTFNGDTGTNYAISRIQSDGSTVTGASAASAANLALNAGTTAAHKFYVVNIVNISTLEKSAMSTENSMNTAGASNIPLWRVVNGKWANTATQITRVDVTNAGTGDYATGSEVVVFGHD